MNHLLLAWVLVGDMNRYQSMGEYFRSGNAGVDRNTFWIVMFCLVLLVTLASWASYYYYAADRHGLNKPGALFRSLCRLHQLTWTDRRLLIRLARAKQLEHTAEIFLRPDCFQPERYDVVFRAEMLEKMEKLRHRLFERTGTSKRKQ